MGAQPSVQVWNRALSLLPGRRVRRWSDPSYNKGALWLEVYKDSFEGLGVPEAAPEKPKFLVLGSCGTLSKPQGPSLC